MKSKQNSNRVCICAEEAGIAIGAKRLKINISALSKVEMPLSDMLQGNLGLPVLSSSDRDLNI